MAASRTAGRAPHRRSPRVASALAAAGAAAAACAQPPLTGCAARARGVPLPDAVRETSGAAWSRTRAGVAWTHNDSGNPPELVAFDSAGRLVARVRVAGAVNRDWEDMAVGPCGGGAGECLYLADIGDNGGGRDQVTVYRVREPAPGDTVTAEAERFAARYPGGPRDAEAFFVLPEAGGGVSAFVVTKGRHGPVELFRFPLDAAALGTLGSVRVLAPAPGAARDQVTGAGATPDGRWVAVRSYATLAIYRRSALFGGGAPALRTPLAALDEPQGEAVALAGDGRVLLTTEARRPTFSVLTCPLR